MNPVEKGLNLLRSYSMRVPMWIRLVVIGVALVVPAYWAVTYSGMFRWVAELQMGGETGEYSATLAFLVPCLFFLLPGLALIIILGNFFPEKSEQETKMGPK